MRGLLQSEQVAEPLVLGPSIGQPEMAQGKMLCQGQDLNAVFNIYGHRTQLNHRVHTGLCSLPSSHCRGRCRRSRSLASNLTRTGPHTPLLLGSC